MALFPGHRHSRSGMQTLSLPPLDCLNLPIYSPLNTLVQLVKINHSHADTMASLLDRRGGRFEC